METDNLVALKDDMVAFIEGHGLRRLPGYVTEDIPAILWEGEDNPDSWKDFVEMAKHAGALFVTELSSFTNIAQASTGVQFVIQGVLIALSVIAYRMIGSRAGAR